MPIRRYWSLETEVPVWSSGCDESSGLEPETNGCVEKFIQTLKEQVLWIERFDTLEQLRARIRQFVRDYNEHWLLERHGYRTPRQARDALRQAAMA
jgi:putative transposase